MVLSRFAVGTIVGALLNDASDRMTGCFAEQNSVLIKDVDGTPSDGYGRVFYDSLARAAWQ